MWRDAKEYSKKCDICQRFTESSHLHVEPLHSASISWPFVKWGMDIVGKKPIGSHQKVYVLVLLHRIDQSSSLQQNLRYCSCEIRMEEHHMLLRHTQRDSHWQQISIHIFKFHDSCKKWGIKLIFSTPRYSASNGQAKASNKTIINNSKRILHPHKGHGWKNYLLYYGRTRQPPEPQRGKPLFRLSYDLEVVILARMRTPSSKISLHNEENNSMELLQNLNTLNEARDEAAIQIAAYHQTSQTSIL